MLRLGAQGFGVEVSGFGLKAEKGIRVPGLGGSLRVLGGLGGLGGFRGVSGGFRGV